MKRVVTYFFLVNLVVWLGGSCAKAPKSHEALIGSPLEVPVVSEDLQQFKLDLDNTTIKWIGTKPTGMHSGTLGVSDGKIMVKGTEVKGGDFTIDLHDIDVLDLQGKEKTKLIKHLMSSDFFDVENHPVARFEITSVQPFMDDTLDSEVNNEYVVQDATHKISGNLTLRGTSLSVSFPARIILEENILTAIAKFNIDRTKWGVSYWEESTLENRTKDKFIYDIVHIGIILKTNI